jgi:hypothetical protein
VDETNRPIDESNPPADETHDDHRTLQDKYRQQVGERASETAARLRSARELLTELNDEFKVAKNNVDGQKELIAELEGELRQLALDMAAINDGTYTPAARQQKLPFNQGEPGEQAPAGPPMGHESPIAELVKYGCPGVLLNLLPESQLANERKLETVADLLAAISSDPYWFKKVKGMGEERRDALINAITAWGEDHKPADTRRKQCNNDECQASPSKGIFDTTVHAEGECPECGETEFFTRIDDEV